MTVSRSTLSPWKTAHRSPPLKSSGKIPARIPRPANCFILFRSFRVKELKNEAQKRGVIVNQRELSKQVSTEWHNLSGAQLQVWVGRQQEEVRKHQAKYPGWKFHHRTSAEIAEDKRQREQERMAARVAKGGSPSGSSTLDEGEEWSPRLAAPNDSVVPHYPDPRFPSQASPHYTPSHGFANMGPVQPFNTGGPTQLLPTCRDWSNHSLAPSAFDMQFFPVNRDVSASPSLAGNEMSMHHSLPQMTNFYADPFYFPSPPSYAYVQEPGPYDPFPVPAVEVASPVGLQFGPEVMSVPGYATLSSADFIGHEFPLFAPSGPFDDVSSSDGVLGDLFPVGQVDF